MGSERSGNDLVPPGVETFSVGELDIDAVGVGLTRWLRDRWPERSGLALASLEGNAANGRSSDTLFADVVWTEGRDERQAALVVRLPPTGGGLFPTYDLELQGRFMEAVRGQGLPAPRVVAYEGDEAWVGLPFLVMDRIVGRVPGDFLTPDDTPWLYASTQDEQSALSGEFVDTLADLHRLDWEALDLGSAARPSGVGLDAEIDWWAYFVDWGSDGDPPSQLTDALVWVRESRPDPEPPLSIVWGDARFGNVLVDDAFRIAGILDWEMACIAPGEVDLGWHLEYQRQFANRVDVLPGLLDRDQIIARYEQRRGRDVGDPRWYEMFARIRLASLGLSMGRIFRERDPALGEMMQQGFAQTLDALAQAVDDDRGRAR